MATTPVRKTKLSSKDLKFKTDHKKDNHIEGTTSRATTPLNNKIAYEDDYSPVYFPSTQESNEDIDVLWDWHSPQTSHKRRKKLKPLLPVQSPKFPIKRYPSNNQQSQNFERLQNELKALQEELAMPDDESVLCVSPLQESEFNEIGSNNSVVEEPQCDNDLFNDSIDEQLVLFSQKVEDLFKNDKINEIRHNMGNSTMNMCDTSEINNILNKYKNEEKNWNSADDSFDMEFSNIPIEEIAGATKTPKPKILFQRNFSDISFNKPKQNVTQTVSGKLELYRTKSFELPDITQVPPNNPQVNLTKDQLDEIERKRVEAKARLEAKRKQENLAISRENIIETTSGKLEFHRTRSFELSGTSVAVTNNPLSDFTENKLEEIERKRLEAKARLEAKKKLESRSLNICSHEEIEKKRLQAIAKLEAKRLQDIVEKKRQEALKKLQQSRAKNAGQVKSSLTTRL